MPIGCRKCGHDKVYKDGYCFANMPYAREEMAEMRRWLNEVDVSSLVKNLDMQLEPSPGDCECVDDETCVTGEDPACELCGGVLDLLGECVDDECVEGD